MNWKELWMTLFGTTEWLGLNIGFWVAMAVVLLIVIVMNVVFWSMKQGRCTVFYCGISLSYQGAFYCGNLVVKYVFFYH